MEKQISFFLLGFVAALSITSLFTTQKQRPAQIMQPEPVRSNPQYALNLDAVSRALSLNLLDYLHQESLGPTP